MAHRWLDQSSVHKSHAGRATTRIDKRRAGSAERESRGRHQRVARERLLVRRVFGGLRCADGLHSAQLD